MKNLKLRPITQADCQIISSAFKDQGWNKPVAQYQEYLSYKETGKRAIIIAEYDGLFAGYLTILWESNYQPFLEKGIPEIVDFNVLKKYQRLGIGTALMDEAEKLIKRVSNYAGIGFGVYKDYGAAQILYINRAYIPDGNGLLKDGNLIQYGETITIDDSIVFYLTKKL